MKRKIISIDETKCTGCGQCIPDCPEGALQIIDGKARLVSDLFCDGLGACIGTCPEGAISVVEREASPYDEKAVMATIVNQGVPVIKAHLEHLAGHGEVALYDQAVGYLIGTGTPIPDHTPPQRPEHPRTSIPAGTPHPGPGRVGEGTCRPGPLHQHPFASCPGSAARRIIRDSGTTAMPHPLADSPAVSELRQWPIQLSLLHPAASYFENADLLVAADCVPFAYAGFHRELLHNRIVIIFCPKLDPDIEGYIEKMAEIFTLHTIRSVTVVHMEVPCCNGVRYVVEKALEKAGKQVPIADTTISIQGEVLP